MYLVSFAFGPEVLDVAGDMQAVRALATLFDENRIEFTVSNGHPLTPDLFGFGPCEFWLAPGDHFRSQAQRYEDDILTNHSSPEG